ARIESLGLKASPHIAARRLESERSLRAALDELRDSGVEQVLLIAGDLAQPLGPFRSSLDILNTGLLARAGIRLMCVAGRPAGHKAIGRTMLWDALERKQEFADRSGTDLHIVTQFGFNPKAICDWDLHLRRHGISLPVHVGIAGPTSLPKLIKFAMHC